MSSGNPTTANLSPATANLSPATANLSPATASLGLETWGQPASDDPAPRENCATDSQAVSQTDFYQLLGLSRESTLQQIKEQYRKLSLLYHPDKSTGNANKYTQINLAYKVLSNEKRRQKYDASLAGSYQELREAPRDTGYHRNSDFLKADETFDSQKFSQLFRQENPTLDQMIPIDVQEPVETRLQKHLNERDNLVQQFQAHSQNTVNSLRQMDTQQFGDYFNSAFEDLCKHNKELAEALVSSGTSEIDSAYPTTLGSDWQPSNNIGIISGESTMNLQDQGFQSQAIEESWQRVAQAPQTSTTDWRNKASDDLLAARMQEYLQDSKRLQEYRPEEFIVSHNPDLLSHQEIAESSIEETQE